MFSTGDGEIAPLPEVADADEQAALAAAERLVPAVHRHDGVAPERTARYAWAAPLVAGRSVLDAACGAGWGTALLAKRAGRAVGVDSSQPAIAAARREHGDSAEFQVGDLRQLPLADGELDAAVCFEAIERVPDPARALDELRRVLAPRGLLLISAVNRETYPPGNPFHLHELAPAELRDAVAARFANVALYRQQTLLASLIADDDTFAAADPARAVAAEAVKAVASPPAAALYSVVVASDGELPEPPPSLALGGSVDRDEQARLLELWRERATVAEVEAAALRTELEFHRRGGS